MIDNHSEDEVGEEKRRKERIGKKWFLKPEMC